MTELKHTPTPYRAIPKNDLLKRHYIVCANDTYCPGLGKEVVAENIRSADTADFIVRACNAHYALLETAKIGLAHLEGEEGSDRTEGDFVRAAIAKATGGE